MSQYIDPESIYAHFPANKSAPQRLIELLDWLDLSIDDTVGWFPEFTWTSLDWFFPPIDLSPYFGVFANLGDGSLLAYWFYEECDPRNPPIVVLGTDGELGVVADSVEELVARITSGKFPDTCWADLMVSFYLYRDGSLFSNLWEWAKEIWGLTDDVRDQLTASQPGANHPNLEEWMARLE
ncbi:MAG: hypothetical protein QNJ46_31390 [Leptolyngbyaceae cyanobacterium MO_188.B28]|nr:hypothetical protein [Leptolyngbyaceae cyanobacterium MO_188.B28]